MKRVAAILMVLSMASLASATTLSISGPATLNNGQTATYTVSYSGGSVGGFDLDIVVDDVIKGTLSNVVINDPHDPYKIQPLIWPPPESGPSGYQVSNLADVGDSLPVDLFTIDLTAVGTVDQVINVSMEGWSFFDADLNSIDATLEGKSVTITPEPITLALLGLGGLFVRRR